LLKSAINSVRKAEINRLIKILLPSTSRKYLQWWHTLRLR